MIRKIQLPIGTSFFETNLDGDAVAIRMYYSKSIDRFLMDVENKRLKRESVGIVVNVGIDLLVSSGRLGLQALVLASAPRPFFEATLANYSDSLQLLYMDLKTYDEFLLNGNASSRRQWIEQTPNEI